MTAENGTIAGRDKYILYPRPYFVSTPVRFVFFRYIKLIFNKVCIINVREKCGKQQDRENMEERRKEREMAEDKMGA